MIVPRTVRGSGLGTVQYQVIRMRPRPKLSSIMIKHNARPHAHQRSPFSQGTLLHETATASLAAASDMLGASTLATRLGAGDLYLLQYVPAVPLSDIL